MVWTGFQIRFRIAGRIEPAWYKYAQVGADCENEAGLIRIQQLYAWCKYLPVKLQPTAIHNFRPVQHQKPRQMQLERFLLIFYHFKSIKRTQTCSDAKRAGGKALPLDLVFERDKHMSCTKEQTQCSSEKKENLHFKLAQSSCSKSC